MAERLEYHGGLPLSEAVIVQGHLAVIAGQVAPEGTALSVRDQTLATLNELDKVLARLRVDRTAVVRCLCFLADLNTRPEFNEAYAEFFVSDYPTRTTVGAQLLPGLLVEIEAFVELPPETHESTARSNS